MEVDLGRLGDSLGDLISCVRWCGGPEEDSYPQLTAPTLQVQEIDPITNW